MAPTDDCRILDLLMPMFSGSKDEYGKELVPPLPLSFDRVNGNQPPVSDAALFKLPFELLALILQHVQSSSLSSLALVNSDCRQLARSAQFASVKFDYSRESQLLLLNIEKEHLQRELNQRPSIASCIRRVTVATHPAYIQRHHQISLDEDFASLDIGTRDSRLNAASQAVFDVYFPRIQKLVCDPTIFRQLELLDWEDKIVLPKSFFNALPLSTIQHLKLFRTSITEEFKLELGSSLPTRGWPLHSLHLEIQSTIRGKACDISPLCHSMLRLSASTLESLTWDTGPLVAELDTFAVDKIDSPTFPRLRYLELNWIDFKDCATLEALVHDGLRVLNVQLSGSSKVEEEFFSTRGCIPSLKVFVWHGHKSLSLPAEFLKSNNQLSKLSMDYQAPSYVLENDLLPILSDSFRALTSLQLTWESDSIPESSLKTIATLKTLRQLHLSAGCQFGWKHTWLVNHNTMLKALSPLSSLKKLAFSRDTYQHKYSWVSAETYYIDKIVGRGETWEEVHQDRMLREADKYVWEMPNLSWVYLGQLPMKIKRRPNGTGWPVLLSTERDDCWTLLKQMFGWKEGEKMWESAILQDGIA